MSTTTSRTGERRIIASIEGLSFRYPDSQRPTLKDVSLEIGEGEVVLLAGPSGCGKSTLLRCMNGLIPHMYPGDYKGSVSVSRPHCRRDPHEHALARRWASSSRTPRTRSSCSRSRGTSPSGSRTSRSRRQEMRSRVDEAMRLLGITDLAHRAPHELSDGQKQRAALAGVIAMRPKLIILDEPTSLLDPKTALEVVSPHREAQPRARDNLHRRRAQARAPHPHRRTGSW